MIHLKNIVKRYDAGDVTVTALEEITLTIDQGEYIAVMGSLGSGKSTLMNIIGIIDTPNEGQYFLEEYDIMQFPDKERVRIRNHNFGFIFPSFNLLSKLNSIENVMLPMTYVGVTVRDGMERAKELLDRVGMSHRFYHLPPLLSKEEQKRVAIARSLANNPDVILAYEPTENLPGDTWEPVLQTLEELPKTGITVVVFTNNEMQGNRAERRIRIQGGKLARPAEAVI